MFAHDPCPQVNMPELSRPKGHRTRLQCNGQGRSSLSRGSVAEGRYRVHGRTVQVRAMAERFDEPRREGEKRAAKSGRNGRAARIRDRSTL